MIQLTEAAISEVNRLMAERGIEDTIIRLGSGFRFHNPNTARTCGCGTSFRV